MTSARFLDSNNYHQMMIRLFLFPSSAVLTWFDPTRKVIVNRRGGQVTRGTRRKTETHPCLLCACFARDFLQLITVNLLPLLMLLRNVLNFRIVFKAHSRGWRENETTALFSALDRNVASVPSCFVCRKSLLFRSHAHVNIQLLISLWGRLIRTSGGSGM